MNKAGRQTSYEKWMESEGIPIAVAYGVGDIVELPREPWARLGGRGTYVNLHGMEGVTGMYVLEIPPGGALNPEKHLYEEIMYVLRGSGSTKIEGGAGGVTFEWRAGSLFAIPLNTPHRLYNGSGTEPAIILGFTNAPMVMDLYHSPDFVFGCDFTFSDRYTGQADHFVERNERYTNEYDGNRQWVTNFVPDVGSALLDPREYKAPGRTSTQVEMSEGVVVTHIAQWANGRYDKAHHHGGGAVLLIVRGRGYSLMWPQELGVHPYSNGHGDKVVRVDWKVGSVFGPPSGWFHQHFNSGPEPARQLAMRFGSRRHRVGFHEAPRRAGTNVSVKQGGTLIEYEDEDPQIRPMFEADCARNGVAVDMPHRTDVAAAG